ncbi:MAG: hypothetical protein A2583_10085 [Bdellovibrionales bacterium RIFOXYD1_FULL_53_11]|nr:MAG: hypothetical protein A2583_10085 [Bdellovibrionales bacterium RIFOXYD1_FULL_53_11]
METEFLTIQEAALFLRVQVSTLYGWCHERRIPFRKHGSRVIFCRSEILKWSERHVIPPRCQPFSATGFPDKNINAMLTTDGSPSDSSSLKTRRDMDWQTGSKRR